MFFFDGKLHRKRKIVKSEGSSGALRAWNYKEQSYVSIPLNMFRRQYKQAYTVSQAASLINVTLSRVRELMKLGLVKQPERAYEFLNGTYAPQREYISQEDMLDLRQAAWDALRKNKFGEPYDDSMPSEQELEFRMQTGDDREYVTRDDGTVIKIYQA